VVGLIFFKRERGEFYCADVYGFIVCDVVVYLLLVLVQIRLEGPEPDVYVYGGFQLLGLDNRRLPGLNLEFGVAFHYLKTQI
jgi:hypothetical protein